MWRAIFRKEFVEVFGDARTRFNVVVGPLIFTPLLLALIGTVARNQAAEAQKEKVEVGVVGLQNAPSVALALPPNVAKGITFVPIDSAAEIERRIRDRTLRVGLVVADTAESNMKSETPA